MPRYVDLSGWDSYMNDMLDSRNMYDNYDIGYTDAMDRVDDWIDEQPTIDPESLRPHGRWVQNGQCEHKPGRIKNTDHWTTYKCSVCGASNGRYKRHNYCHNCGAKMDLAQATCGDCLYVELCETDHSLTEFSRDNPAYCKKFHPKLQREDG